MPTATENVKAEVRPREQVFTKGTVLPLAFSSITTGIWAELAFGRSASPLKSLIFVAAGIFVSAAVFSFHLIRIYCSAVQRKTARYLERDLARCSFASVVFLISLPEYLARVQPPHLRSILLIGIVASLWFALTANIVRHGFNRPLSAKDVNLTGYGLLVVLFTFTTAVAIRKYLVFAYVGQDLAYFSQILHTTWNGHLFWGNLLQDLLYSKSVTTDFAGHNSPAMFLLLPFYGLFPSPITLIVLRNLVIFACAIPIISIARRSTSLPVAWIWAFAFVLTPTVFYQTTFDFYPLSFVALPLLFCVDFYLSRRFLAFCVALMATLIVREDLVFFVFGLGLLGLLQRRSSKWSVTPMAAATVWGVLSFLIIMPHALHGASFVTDACFCHLGTSPIQMAGSVLKHPTQNVLSHNNIVYLKTLFTPSGLVLALGSPLSILAAPYLAINLLAGGGACITNVIYAQYSVIPATILFLGSLLCVTKKRGSIFARVASLGLRGSLPAALVLLALAACSLIFTTGVDQVQELQRPAWQSEAEHVLTLIPSSASVAAPRYLLPHLANRDCLYQTHRLSQYHHPIYEYLIIDETWSHINASSAYEKQYQQLRASSETNPSLHLIYASPQYRVYQNPTAHNLSCFSDQ